MIPSPIGRLITTVRYINDKLNLIGPNEKICALLQDKNAVNSFLKNNSFNCLKKYTIDGIEDIKYPVIIKRQFGAGSRDVKIVHNIEELLEYTKIIKIYFMKSI